MLFTAPLLPCRGHPRKLNWALPSASPQRAHAFVVPTIHPDRALAQPCCLFSSRFQAFLLVVIFLCVTFPLRADHILNQTPACRASECNPSQTSHPTSHSVYRRGHIIQRVSYQHHRGVVACDGGHFRPERRRGTDQSRGQLGVRIARVTVVGAECQWPEIASHCDFTSCSATRG